MEHTAMKRFPALAASAVLVFSSAAAKAQSQSSISGRVETKRTLPPISRVVSDVREYRQANEDRIMRELREFLAIPNVASDTANIQENADHLKEMLEARGIETHLLS